MDLEVLVATMQQTDFSLVEKMNLRQNAVIANQCGKWSHAQQQTEFGMVRMLSSDTKGVGINRNLALQAAQGDILLFADDDMTYYEGELQGVIDAFKELPDADVILFGVDMTRNGQVYERRRCRVRRARLWNSMKYGTYRIAVRNQAIKKNNIWFSTLFGGGCQYGCGEDSIFLCDCFRAGLKVYSHCYVLGACAKDSSSWFSGFNKKYFFDRGAMLSCAFPKSKHLIKWYFIWKFSKKTELALITVIKQMNDGIRAYRDLRGFEEAAQASIRGDVL